MTVPIFNRNQGGIARAEAELDQLDRRQQTVHNQIVQDVRTAFARYQQARAELDLLQRKTRPEVEAAIRRAEAAFKEGNVTYLIVLETNRQLIDTYAREAQLHADLRRAWAELERTVGRRLTLAVQPSESTDRTDDLPQRLTHRRRRHARSRAGAAVRRAGGYCVAKPSEDAKPAAPPIPATVPKPFKEDQAADRHPHRRRRGPARAPHSAGRCASRSAGRACTAARWSSRRAARSIVSAPLAGTLKPAGAIAPVAGTVGEGRASRSSNSCRCSTRSAGRT